jgi:hypothetical protein
MLGLLLLCAAAKRPPAEVGIACLSGVWRISAAACALFPRQTFDAVVKPAARSFSVDVGPSRWSHPRVFTLRLADAAAASFIVRDIRLAAVGNLSLAVAPRCRVRSNSTFRIGNHTFFGIVKAGRGVLTAIAADGTACDFVLRKELRRDPWRFSLSLLSGIAAMYIGCRTLLGWGAPEAARPVPIRMDNPGQEYQGPDDQADAPGAPDPFDSDDGY